MLALVPGSVAQFAALCERERCPFAVVGEITGDGPPARHRSAARTATPVDMPIEVLLGKAPRMTARCAHVAQDGRARYRPPASTHRRLARSAAVPADHCRQVLSDHHRRSHRGRHDQPRSDGGTVAGAGGRRRGPLEQLRRVQRRSHGHGRAHAGGACSNAPASGRLAVGEAITNILAADIRSLHRHSPVGELDGGLRRAGRGCGPVRHGARGRRGAVRNARHHHSGRQGLLVDADGVERCRTASIR